MNKSMRLFTGTLLFIIVFYHQHPGLNISLFAFGIWLLSYQSRRKNADAKMTFMLSAACFISQLSFAWYGDGLSFLSLFVTSILAAFYFQFPRLNLLIFPVLSILNLISFPFRFFLFHNWLPPVSGKSKWQRWLAMVIIPAVFLTLFSFVYATGSDLFNQFFTGLFQDLDIVQVMLLSALGFFILFNIWGLWVPRLFFRVNLALTDDFEPGTSKRFRPAFSLFSRELELKSGEVSFLLLNILLLVFVASYNYEQFFNRGGLHALSDETHQRVATVVVSILLAIAMVLFYFKSKMPQGPATHRLGRLAFVWIALNALLVISAFIKNGEYILQYGLTFKRISVIIFLLLCILGLLFTAIKITEQKTNVYLVNRMAWSLLVTLVLMTPINFSWIVTKYNIAFQDDPDASYLRSLDYNKHLLIKHFGKDPEWRHYMDNLQEHIHDKRSEPLLSCSLYYRGFAER